MSVQQEIDSLIVYIDEAVARSSVSNRHVASVLDFLNQRQKSVADAVLKTDIASKGSATRPVYIDSSAVPQPVTGITVPGAVIGEAGVAALGIASADSSYEGPVDDVIPYEELEQQTSEDTTKAASAYAAAHLKADIGIAGFQPFSEETDYARGETCRHGGLPYRFLYDHPSGPWDLSSMEQITYRELASPLAIAASFFDTLS